MTSPDPRSVWMTARVAAADFLFVWLVIGFLRFFVVENYRVPTGSMTPTLVGGRIAQLDLDGDGDEDYALLAHGQYEYFENTPQGFAMTGDWRPTRDQEARIKSSLRGRYDNILVGKFSYWFRPPRRGDIAVFKPPDSEYRREAPVFVKRVVGLPGETVSIGPDTRLWVNGAPVVAPPLFTRLEYAAEYRRGLWFQPRRLAAGEYLFFGDNTLNSSDGRYWGPTPRDNIRGKVFFRYWPLYAFGFL